MSSVPGSGNLLYVHDSLNDVEWLIDSGASYSIIPPTSSQRVAGPQGEGLRAANGTNISCYGSMLKTLCIGNKQYQFEFIVADVKNHIIGSDFLAEFYLAPNHT